VSSGAVARYQADTVMSFDGCRTLGMLARRTAWRLARVKRRLRGSSNETLGTMVDGRGMPVTPV
jgi:hypothetical protein